MIFSQDALNKMFGEAWAHLLFEKFDMGQEFDQVIKSLGPELKKYVVYPPRPQVFRAFKDTRPETVKVIFLVQDPYHDGRANGHAISNEDDGKLSPTLSVFKKEWREDTGGVTTFDPTFMRFIRQGVMFLNTALTVREAEPKSHANLWTDWTRKFITKYSDYNPECLWVLMGKHAQGYQVHIQQGHVLKTVHPAAETYSGGKSGFFGSKPFYRINKQLAKIGKPLISW